MQMIRTAWFCGGVRELRRPARDGTELLRSREIRLWRGYRLLVGTGNRPAIDFPMRKSNECVKDVVLPQLARVHLYGGSMYKRLPKPRTVSRYTIMRQIHLVTVGGSNREGKTLHSCAAVSIRGSEEYY